MTPVSRPIVDQGGSESIVEYAGFWARAASEVVDLLLLGTLFLIIRTVTGTLGIPYHSYPLIPDFLAPVDWVATLWRLVTPSIAILYRCFLLSSARGATVGKLAFGLRVTDDDGDRLTFGHALGRDFAHILDLLTLGIGYLMAVFTKRKQALHDLAAYTLVIKVRRVH